jgi:uroporphyrinogen-III synthase
LLIVNYGGRPVVAPALREVPLDANQGALEFANRLIRRDYDMVILTTGVGTRLFLRTCAPVVGHDALIAALGTTRVVARGPKPLAALREEGLSAWLTAPSPHTWREVVAMLDQQAPGVCERARIALQEYGATNPELVEALESRGAQVAGVPIYRWELPDDVEPLRAAVRAIVEGRIDVVLLTASVQLVHLLHVAADMEMELEARAGLERLVVASIGPMTSDELRRHALPVDMVPSHPKMGFLVKEAAELCADLLGAKRAAAVRR